MSVRSEVKSVLFGIYSEEEKEKCLSVCQITKPETFASNADLIPVEK